MSILGDDLSIYEDAWNGNSSVGDVARVEMDTADKIPEIGDALPDGDEAKSAVDGAVGDGGHHDGGGNLGNHIGTIAGGLLGLPFGGLGAPTAALGSKVGGWISDMADGDHSLVDAARLGMKRG